MCGEVDQSEAGQRLSLQGLLSRGTADEHRRGLAWKRGHDRAGLVARGRKRSQLLGVHVVHAARDAPNPGRRCGRFDAIW